jgi:hypothetical protein
MASACYVNSVLTLSWATAVARLRLPAHVADLVSDAEVLDSPRDNGRYVCGLNISGVGEGCHGSRAFGKIPHLRMK